MRKKNDPPRRARKIGKRPGKEKTVHEAPFQNRRKRVAIARGGQPARASSVRSPKPAAPRHAKVVRRSKGASGEILRRGGAYIEGNPEPSDAQEKAIYAVLPEDGSAVHLDRIMKDAGISTSTALTHLLALEIRDVVEQMPGKMFRRSGVDNAAPPPVPTPKKRGLSPIERMVDAACGYTPPKAKPDPWFGCAGCCKEFPDKESLMTHRHEKAAVKSAGGGGGTNPAPSNPTE